MFSKTAIGELADAADPHRPLRRRSGSLATLRRAVTIGLLCLTICGIYSGSVLYRYLLADYDIGSSSLPLEAPSILNRCKSLQLLPGPPADFYSRARSDRFQPGTSPVLIRNATIWTGFTDGSEIVHGDILLSNGLIQAMSNISQRLLIANDNVTVIDAAGAWLTPGVIDLHSHMSISPAPAMKGTGGDNSEKGPVVPWLRALDALNTHDEGFLHAISGGVTTSLVLPGSLNAIGGQGFVIKLRPTSERSPSSMLLEPPFGLNGSKVDPDVPPRWRHMKHACGENPRNYGDTRMDTVWAVREAYNTARKIKTAQDDYCTKALAGDWRSIQNEKFPESYQWESMVEILRGRVKVQTHCYEALDIDNFIRLSNEFQFPVAAFHHAHEAYLVPDVLKRAHKNIPAIAMFSTFARYKREAYRHSEHAPAILAQAGIDVVMKSDHSAIVSRNLMHEAAVAHYYGLDNDLALASVISTPAKVLGLDHRIGYIAKGYDADVVLWDSHPLSLGATPTQVFIDGIPQLSEPNLAPKPARHQNAPNTPDFTREAALAVRYEGLPPLAPARQTGMVTFTNMSSYWTRSNDRTQNSVVDIFRREDSAEETAQAGRVVVVSDGRVLCAGSTASCATSLSDASTAIDLQGGAVQPALVNYGSALGLGEIALEASTGDGTVIDPLERHQPALLGREGYVARAIDGLQFGTRDALLAYRSGITLSVTPPVHDGWFSGLSVAFSPGAPHRLAQGAIVRDVVAVHCTLGHGDPGPSVSSKIAVLRRLLTERVEGEVGAWFRSGTIPLVVDVGSADIISTLIALKKEVEVSTRKPLKLTIAGASEAHLVADDLAEADVGVIVTPPRSYPYTWDERRGLPGPPLSADSLIGHLMKHNVTVALGTHGIEAPSHPGAMPMANWATRNLRFDAGEAMLDAGPGLLSKADAYDLVSSNVEKLLGLETDRTEHDLVATVGGDLLDFEGKVVAVISPRQGVVDIFA
ncbi:composite domain of metallo-dependent hydrolase [Trametes sanguinea]|nr:composite domain of metallo-dependent hydrolase [Trametes sanguinea]